MKFMQTEKKQLLIYVIIAYGITYVMGLLMWYGYGKGLDLSSFSKGADAVSSSRCDDGLFNYQKRR